jgi:hypothetical protein
MLSQVAAVAVVSKEIGVGDYTLLKTAGDDKELVQLLHEVNIDMVTAISLHPGKT